MGTQKDKYIDKMAQQLKEWSATIDELESRVIETSADVKAGYVSRIRELKEKRDALSLKLRDLGETSGEAWDALKTGVEASWKDLKDAISTVRDKFKKAA